MELAAWPLLFVGAVLQLSAELLPDDRSWSTGASVGMILGSYVLLLVVVYINQLRTGLWLAGLGILLNFMVIGFNGGMPVSAEAASLAGAGDSELVFSAKHVALDANSRLTFLADVIPFEPLGQVVSIGDVFLAVGLGRFLESELRTRHWLRHPEHAPPGSAAGQ